MAPNTVRDMFARITPTYDRLNFLLSFGLDRYWRRAVLPEIPFHPAKIIDVCTGTGDLAFLLLRHGHEVIGVDFCAPMLEKARQKTPKGVYLEFIEADASQLPFPSESFQVLTSAFSLRNLADLKGAFREAYRVLVPGGKALFLDLTRPQTFLTPIHRFYLETVLPKVGKAVSGDPHSYRYLSQSVLSFHAPSRIQELLISCSFKEAKFRSLTWGICTLWTAVK